jgi:hypothetical protein
MHRRHVLIASAALVSLVSLVSGRASAQTSFFANLTNGQENPPATPTLSPANGSLPRPASFGTATFLLNAAQTSLTFSATIFNIDFTGSQTADTFDNLTAAHIHASPTVTPTTNGGVVWGFFGAPFNDNNPNDVVFTPFLTGVGGTISGKWDNPEGNGGTTLAAQLPLIFAGRSYINFHTTQFGGGEVRGAITAVPEPATVLLLGAGLLGVGAIGWKRRRS